MFDRKREFCVKFADSLVFIPRIENNVLVLW